MNRNLRRKAFDDVWPALRQPGSRWVTKLLLEHLEDPPVPPASSPRNKKKARRAVNPVPESRAVRAAYAPEAAYRLRHRNAPPPPARFRGEIMVLSQAARRQKERPRTPDNGPEDPVARRRFHHSRQLCWQGIRGSEAQESKAMPHITAYEDPRFWIMDMEEKGYKCWVAAWADSPVDAWELGNEIRTELIKQFRACGIKTHKLEHGGMARPGDY